MNHFPSREQVQALRERYPPGTMIQLTADMQGERFGLEISEKLLRLTMLARYIWPG